VASVWYPNDLLHAYLGCDLQPHPYRVRCGAGRGLPGLIFEAGIQMAANGRWSEKEKTELMDWSIRPREPTNIPVDRTVTLVLAGLYMLNAFSCHSTTGHRGQTQFLTGRRNQYVA